MNFTGVLQPWHSPLCPAMALFSTKRALASMLVIMAVVT
jgi:hypothetical protein